MEQILESLVAELMKARHFDDAAAIVLRPMLSLCARTLASSRFAGRGKILRAMAHLRPSDGYRSLVIVEEGSETASPSAAADGAAPAFLPSATAWRWVAAHGCPVSIDVNVGRVEVHRASSSDVVQAHGKGTFESNESAQRLLSREASHVLVVPLRAPATGAVAGIISIEADCRAAVGLGFPWSEHVAGLELLANVAAPYLTSLPPSPAPPPAPDELLPVIGASMARVVAMLRVFARQEETILIGGPTGAGKSRLARFCHEQSRRRGRRFESLDLVTMPEDLQMAELFGWRKGAFTGALKDNPGSIARAEGGTLLIDEIDKLSLRAQAGLLHVIEERLYRPLGEGGGERQADVRFMVGTNADLHALVAEGRFREDLYYRINVLPVRVPPLEERTDEIVAWARYMANRRQRDGGPVAVVRIAPEAEEVLLRARWPGNLRQLDNIVRRAFAMALIEHGAEPADVLLRREHFEQALEYEIGETGAPLTELLRKAAEAFVREAQRRSTGGITGALDLDTADVLRGFVLAAAVRALGSKEAAFVLLGKKALLANRNHHKALRREIEKVEALYRALGRAGDMPFADLLSGDEK